MVDTPEIKVTGTGSRREADRLGRTIGDAAARALTGHGQPPAEPTLSAPCAMRFGASCKRTAVEGRAPACGSGFAATGAASLDDSVEGAARAGR